MALFTIHYLFCSVNLNTLLAVGDKYKMKIQIVVQNIIFRKDDKTIQLLFKQIDFVFLCNKQNISKHLVLLTWSAVGVFVVGQQI